MKQFFKFMFASMLGTALLMGISSMIFMVLMITMIAGTQTELPEVNNNSILHLKFDKPIYERTSEDPFDNFNFSDFKSTYNLGLNDILSDIKYAANDENIKGIFLDISILQAGNATVVDIRNALEDFKKSGKFIIAYSEFYTQQAYYLATVADKVYLNPEGILMFKGLSAQIFFLKGLMEKIEIQPQIIRHGKFKSAVEPLINEKMSEENREQTRKFISSIWDHMLNDISKSRNISIPVLNNIADSLLCNFPEHAVALNMLDGIKYKDEILDELHTLTGTEKDDKLNFVSINKYHKTVQKEYSGSSNKIAVVYAQGDIVSGKGDSKTIGSEKISEALRQARSDSSVKAVVFRINSPGGSALASEVIWREVQLIAKTKPIVASMGDLAASGGYYIACPATKIIACPATITGSIGVFGIIPNMQKLFNNKLGITFDGVSTNANSDYITVTRSLNDYEKQTITATIENIYQKFILHVAEGRNMTVAQVDSIGQGRVWSGTDAKTIGLIDDFGGLEKAIETAAELANISEYQIVEYPKQKDVFIQLIEQLTGKETESYIKNELGENYIYYQYIKEITEIKGIQARLPYEINIY